MQKNNTHSSSDGKSDAANRCGETSAPLAPSRGTWPIYAPAGQCDYGSDGNAWIAFDRVGDFVFEEEEEHIYVGSEPLLRDKGEYFGTPGGTHF